MYGRCVALNAPTAVKSNTYSYDGALRATHLPINLLSSFLLEVFVRLYYVEKRR